MTGVAAAEENRPVLTVWGRKTSSNVQALMWCIGELGLSLSDAST